ncbi:MAG: hypothetical protein HWN81_00065 [Candidatus Lokiarchaeota archaeon]|nr:hypothetical protein [Candidatus Lokiarchaeota archaeon]
MARKKKGQKKLEDWLDYEYEAEYTWKCPVRGTVTEKVKIKRYKVRLTKEKHIIVLDNDISNME